MKKTISFFLFILSAGIFWGYSSYTNGQFDYQVAQFIGYIFYWSVALFIISLFAWILNNKKYKIFSLISLVYILLAVLLAYEAGDGNGAIVSFDGKDLTIIFAGLYSFVSIIYFIVQFFKNRKSSDHK